MRDENADSRPRPVYNAVYEVNKRVVCDVNGYYRLIDLVLSFDKDGKLLMVKEAE